MQVWYDAWRDKQNKLVRKDIALLKEVDEEKGLDFTALSDVQKVLLKRIRSSGFIIHETVVRRSIKKAKVFQKAGWLTQDRLRRWQLTIMADAYFEGQVH